MQSCMPAPPQPVAAQLLSLAQQQLLQQQQQQQQQQLQQQPMAPPAAHPPLKMRIGLKKAQRDDAAGPRPKKKRLSRAAAPVRTVLLRPLPRPWALCLCL